MKELLNDFIKNLKTNKRINSFDEATTTQAVILKLLSILEWDIFNDEEDINQLIRSIEATIET